MALEGLDATPPLRSGVGKTARGAELPHLDSLVETATDEVLAIRRKGNTVHTVLVSVRPFQALQQIPLVDVPDADALV